ncbi:unnamed protein product [Urochloa humidicola]
MRCSGYPPPAARPGRSAARLRQQATTPGSWRPQPQHGHQRYRAAFSMTNMDSDGGADQSHVRVPNWC